MSESFASLGLLPELLRAVTEEGYEIPTPVQLQSIPVILAGRDVLAGAQTGTGKTAGFTLPMLQRLSHHSHHGGRHAVRALVLTPTRELAAQVEESIRTYGKYLDLKSTLVYGGVGINPQIDALRRGVDILVATPGRLLDHIGQKTVNLSHVEILVLDEADRMLDMGFIRDIRKILALLPKERQNLLFSATFSDEIRELADGLLKDPESIDVARRNAESELVAQRVHPCDQSRKRELLSHLIRTGDWQQVLVFTRTKHGANRLAEQLSRDGIETAAIHGNKSQGARTKALAGFKAGSVRVLVATDLAARGLDIEELPHVINYELPNVPEDYVHRIGRTGRAGSTGEAVSLVSPEERGFLADIEKLMRRKVEQQVIPGFEPGTGTPQSAADERPPRPPQRQRQQQPKKQPQQGRPRPGGNPRGDGNRAPGMRGEGNRAPGTRGDGNRDPGTRGDSNRDPGTRGDSNRAFAEGNRGDGNRPRGGDPNRRGGGPRPGGPRPPAVPHDPDRQPDMLAAPQGAVPPPDDDDWQPPSHEGSQFPSSGRVHGEARPSQPRGPQGGPQGGNRNRGSGRANVPALLRGTNRRTG